MYWKVLLAHWQLLLSTGDTQQQHDRASVGLRVPYTPQVATLSRSQPSPGLSPTILLFPLVAFGC